MECYIYEWKDCQTSIQAFGLTGDSRPIVLTIHGFRPTMFVPVPAHVPRKEFMKAYHKTLRSKHATDATLSFCKRPMLYSTMPHTEWYLRVTSSIMHRRVNASGRGRGDRYVKVVDANGIPMNCVHYHATITPILQYTAHCGIKMSGWVTFPEDAVIQERPHNVDDTDILEWAEKEGAVSHALHYSVQWDAISPIERHTIPQPTVLTFDIETYSSKKHAFPCASRKEDVIFQISAVIALPSKDEPSSILLTLGDLGGHGTLIPAKVLVYPTEKSLLVAFLELVKAFNPPVLAGYNILTFDVPYIARRLQDLCDDGEGVCVQGILPSEYSPLRLRTTAWSSGAYGAQDIKYFTMDGRVWMDLYTHIRREYKFTSYALKHVAKEFFSDIEKDPLTAADIFHGYRVGGKELAMVGKYCVQDSVVVHNLFRAVDLWNGVVEMSSVCCIPTSYVYSRGQQIKVLSQVYTFCVRSHIVSAPPKNRDTYSYQGAYVKDPVAGMYSNIIPFDFKSLYPTVLIAHNIDYTTLVPSTREDIPDEKCHVITWSKDGEAFKFRFLREPRGVLPTIVGNLLKARAETRTRMKSLSKGSMEWNVLNMRQLSFKVSANSMYGIMGVQNEGAYLPLIEGALCTTAMGRFYIHMAAKHLHDRYNAELIYTDTDSCYIHLPGVPTDALRETALRIEQDMIDEQIFPKPMVLEFEDEVYSPFIILTPKRYMYRCLGDVKNKLGFKGVCLARRDTVEYNKNAYRGLTTLIMDGGDLSAACGFIADTIAQCRARSKPVSDFISTCAIKPVEQYKAACGHDESTIPPNLVVKLPAAAQLYLRIRHRELIRPGDRISFVITRRGRGERVSKQCETVAGFKEHAFVNPLDTEYYVNKWRTHTLQLLEAVYGTDGRVQGTRAFDLHGEMDVIKQQIRGAFLPRIRWIPREVE